MTHREDFPSKETLHVAPLESFLRDVFGDKDEAGILGAVDVDTYQVGQHTRLVMFWRHGHEPEYEKIQAKLRETHISWMIDEEIDPVMPVHYGKIPGAEVTIIDDHNLEHPFMAFQFRSPPHQISPVVERIEQL